MNDDDFTDAATSAYEDYVRTPKMNVGTSRDRIAEAYMDAAAWARDHLAAQEPTEDDVQAAVAAILALTDETEETARMDDIDVAWDHARAALESARAVGRDAR